MNIEVRRFKTLSPFAAKKDKIFVHKYVCTDDSCESITDKSQFVPESEALRKLKAQGSGISEADMQYYDYPNGEGNLSDKIPVARLKGVDIAEVSQAIQQDQKDLKAKIEKQQKIDELEAHFKPSVADAQTSINNSSSK